VSRLVPPGSHGWPLIDHCHGGDPVRPALTRPTVRPAAAAPGAQRPRWQLARQTAQFRAVDRLVDRLMHDMPCRLARELATQRLADLLGTPPLLQPVGHELPQYLIAGDLARAGPGTPLNGQLVRGVRPVLAADRIPVPAQLAADRRRAAAQLPGDIPHSCTTPVQVSDPDPLVFGQVAVRDLAHPPARPRDDHGRIMQLPAIPGGDCAAVSPTFPGPPVDPDDPARLRVVVSLRDQPGELLTLLGLRQRTRSLASHRNPRTHRVLRRPLETALS